MAQTSEANNTNATWHRFETLRPDQLREIVGQTPIAYWPLGLLEHHGHHLPVGYDGIKAERLCIRLAERTGGLLLPVMWWGTGGGHGDFPWSFYQDEEATEKVLARTADRLAAQGFKVVVLMAGHYPYQPILDRIVPKLKAAHPKVLFLAGSERSFGEQFDVDVPGDHAARWETTYGLALLPEYVEMDALTPGRDEPRWPEELKAAAKAKYKRLDLEPSSPLFSQLGEDPRGTSSAEDGNRRLTLLCDAMQVKIKGFLTTDSADGHG